MSVFLRRAPPPPPPPKKKKRYSPPPQCVAEYVPLLSKSLCVKIASALVAVRVFWGGQGEKVIEKTF